MTGFRSAQGSRTDWFPTDGTFSNFEFVDTRFGFHPILRRILSLARKLDYKGMLLVVGARLPGAMFFVQDPDFNPERTRLAGHTDLFSYTTP